MLTKEVVFYPAFDKRHKEPSKNYGIHGVSIYFFVKGNKGAVQFAVYTDWHLPNVQDEQTNRGTIYPYGLKPMGADVGYHSAVPQYEGQEPFSGPGECKMVPEGESCYYDGSGLRAEEWVRDILLPKGSEGVWAALKEKYTRMFGEEEWA
jgi:hypothetical protein